MPLEKNHYIALANGKFHNDGIDHKENLKNIFKLINNDENKNKPIVVHFHGGLVNEKNGKVVAEKLTPVYKDADGYPVFFVWESGLLETVSRNLPEVFSEMRTDARNLPEFFSEQLTKISKDEIYKHLLPLLKKFVISKLNTGGDNAFFRGEDTIPMIDNFLVEDELDKFKEDNLINSNSLLLEENDNEFKQLVEEINAHENLMTAINQLSSSINASDDEGISRGDVNRTAKTLVSKKVLAIIKAESLEVEENTRGIFTLTKIVKYLAEIAIAVFKRYRNGTHHGIRLTISEEVLRSIYIDNIGTWVWSNMKQDTVDAFGDDVNTYGGTAFIEHLKTSIATNPRRIVLVGHSTGAVYICNLLKKCDKFGLDSSVKFDIVFLAPACTYDLMAEIIIKHKSRISNIRSFGMQDNLEITDGIVPFIYPASLLYFVSSLLEGIKDKDIDKPILGMQRYLESKTPYKENPSIETVLTYMKEFMFWSDVDEGQGRQSDSHSHGGFDEEKPDNRSKTIESVKHIIKNGF